MQSVAVINQKGGVGKTTTCVNLAHAMSRAGKRVTVLDLDPQGHLAASLGFHERERAGLDAVLLNGASLPDVTVEARENLNLIPAGPRWAELEHLNPSAGVSRGRLLQKTLDGQFADCDFVLMDCPPASGLIVVNALFAADEVLIPMPGDYLALQGLSHLMGTIRNFESMLGHSLKKRIALTRFHPRRRLAQEVRRKLQDYFPGQLLPTPIREAAALAESPGFGKTIFEYRPNSSAAEDSEAMARDYLEERTI
ncbi:MAG: ParA family protein [Chromatiales bacterium]|nr:ParA family protein [Chromatiales bacterium]